jgi:glycosyltransferase involved in cell wall biosynthesis
MRVVHITADDALGGAGRAAFRLHRALREAGAESLMLVRRRLSADPDVHVRGSRLARGLGRWRPLLDELPVAWYRRRVPEHFSSAWLASRIHRDVRRLAPDIVHLHWINHGFVGVGDLARFHWPIVWTFHDIWPIAGGCHYLGDCSRYRERCGRCPSLRSGREHDLSRWVWHRKKRAWRRVPMTAIAPSRWMAEMARASGLWRLRPVCVIPNAVPLDRFRPRPAEPTRREWGLPLDRPLIVFGAMHALGNPKKGFDLLREALAEPWPADSPAAGATLAIFGASRESPIPSLGLPVRHLGVLDDNLLAPLLAAADVVTVPSRMDNLPNVAMEALACGTPVAAFDIGGLPDLIDHGVNGWLARPGDPADLRRGIEWLLKRDAHPRRRAAARAAAERKYSPAAIATAHLALYRKTLEERSSPR